MHWLLGLEVANHNYNCMNSQILRAILLPNALMCSMQCWCPNLSSQESSLHHLKKRSTLSVPEEHPLTTMMDLYMYVHENISKQDQEQHNADLTDGTILTSQLFAYNGDIQQNRGLWGTICTPLQQNTDSPVHTRQSHTYRFQHKPSDTHPCTYPNGVSPTLPLT